MARGLAGAEGAGDAAWAKYGELPVLSATCGNNARPAADTDDALPARCSTAALDADAGAGAGAGATSLLDGANADEDEDEEVEEEEEEAAAAAERAASN